MKKGFHHPKMSPAERAKQFMPFAALKGYEEALRAKEREIESKAEDPNAEVPDTPSGLSQTPF